LTIIKLSRRAVLLILLFTLVETLVLTIWLYLLGNPLVAAVILFVGLFGEHYLATTAEKV
jgi:hypothetical protein